MRFLVLVPGNEHSEGGALPPRKLVDEMTRYNDELVKAGVMLDGQGLYPTSRAARVRFDDDGSRTVIDGPFTESKELVAGYWLWQCRNLDEAIEWAKRAPFGGGVALEIRPIFEMEDFGNALTVDELDRQAHAG